MRMLNIFVRKEAQTIEDLIPEFRRKATFLVMKGDLAGMKNLFAQSAANARMSDQQNQAKVKAAMRVALRDILSLPSSKVKRNWFDDL